MTMTRLLSSRCTRSLAGAALALLAAGGVQAQQVYRSVGADGKITFSDRPPVAGSPAPATPAASGAGGAALPYELQQVVARYPVTLYSAVDCAPCNSGRSLLRARGIPFAERTVTTPEDIAALQRINSEASLPLLTVGAQQLSGFSDAEWKQYLDAAGYPAQSQLPPGYRPSQPAPLVAVRRAPAAPASQDSTPAPAAPQPSVAPPAGTPTPSNPAGISF